MRKYLVNVKVDWFDSSVYMDRFLCKNVDLYTNSLERMRALTNQLSLIKSQRARIANVSCYRGDWNGAHLSNEDWVKSVEDACHAEIVRVKRLPDGERVEVTKLLDEQIAAIEEAEARAARRVIWRRRLRNAALLLPIPVLVSVVIVLARRKRR